MNANDVGTSRLYGGVIAVVSGGYSIWLGATNGGLLMVLLGAIVLIHGLLLFAAPGRLGNVSGPLMVGWSVLMLLNQLSTWWMGTNSGMESGMNGGMGSPPGMGVDPGMVAIALVMLASGIVMWRDESQM